MLKTSIVDDEPFVIRGLLNLLDWEKYNCEIIFTAHSSKDIIEFVETNQIDLLITDIHMPDLDGISLIKKVKTINPNIRIIVISAYDKFSYVKEVLKLGAENYLLKPIDKMELCDTLQKIMENVDNDLSSNLHDISVFRNNILNMWVKNATTDYSFKYQAELAEININSKEYCVILVEFNQGINTSIETIERFISHCKRVFNGNGYFFPESSTRMIGILTSLNTLHKNTLIELSTYNDNIFIAVGNTITSYKDINISYTLAQKYLPVKYMIKMPIIFSGQFIELYSGPSNNDLLMLRILILKDKTKEVLTWWTSVINTIETIERQKYASISIVMNILNAINVTTINLSPLVINLLDKFQTLDNESKLNKWIQDFMHSIFSNDMSEVNSILHPYVKKVMDIVKDKYQDEDVSLKTIANHLAVNSAYLGQLFKTFTGKYFHDYLSGYRLMQVENLLLESKLKISDIAIATGFTSQSYLNKIFKKKYNLSPIEFRQKYKYKQ